MALVIWQHKLKLLISNSKIINNVGLFTLRELGSSTVRFVAERQLNNSQGQTTTKFGIVTHCSFNNKSGSWKTEVLCDIRFFCSAIDNNKKLSYCWETVRRESMPRIAEMDVEMTT